MDITGIQIQDLGCRVSHIQILDPDTGIGFYIQNLQRLQDLGYSIHSDTKIGSVIQVKDP